MRGGHLGSGRWPEGVQRQAVPGPGTRDAGGQRVVEDRQVAAVARRRRHDRAHHTARRHERRDTGRDTFVATQHPVEQRAPGERDGELVRKAGQFGRRRLGGSDHEQRVWSSALVHGFRGAARGLDHRRGVRIDPDGQGRRLGRGAREHGSAVTGTEVDGHPLGAGDQFGQLADVHVHGTPTHHESHAGESTLGRVKPAPTPTPRTASATTASPIQPPATIGILGGGQLGRMLGLAARAMGYRLAVLDPDPDCPAAAVADKVILGTYDDVGAALRLGKISDVVTYELEHVAAAVVDALDPVVPVRPGRLPLVATQDRLAERRFVEAAGIGVAPWRAVRTTADLRAAADPAALGLPLRLKVVIGGYDGRGQIRIVERAEVDGAIERLGREPGAPLLAERELDFDMELSVIVARGVDGSTVTFPIARNAHDGGILFESVAPAPITEAVAARAVDIGHRLADAMGLTGTLTAELFLLHDGSLVVNELAPRVHNSGHWTIEGAATSQFEQHIRAICGLGLGDTDAIAPAAMVNLLGTGPNREARLLGVDAALADPTVHLHLYDKRRVFERRKMGHLTALGDDVDTALAHARAARERLSWGDDTEEGA